MKPTETTDQTIYDVDLDEYGIYLTNEEAIYYLHQEHGLCGCFECEEYRKRMI